MAATRLTIPGPVSMQRTILLAIPMSSLRGSIRCCTICRLAKPRAARSNRLPQPSPAGRRLQNQQHLPNRQSQRQGFSLPWLRHLFSLRHRHPTPPKTWKPISCCLRQRRCSTSPGTSSSTRRLPGSASGPLNTICATALRKCASQAFISIPSITLSNKRPRSRVPASVRSSTSSTRAAISALNPAPCSSSCRHRWWRGHLTSPPGR